MHRTFWSLAIMVTVGSAAASDKTDVMATVNQFNDGINKGDVKTAVAACANPTFIVDEIPPYAWQGATACSDWATDFEADSKKKGITDPFVTLGKPRHVNVTGDRAYVVVPADYKYKLKGKPAAQKGSLLTVALQKGADGWRITGWAWSAH